MCADRQITAAGAFKYHEPKISKEDFDNFSAVFSYAGSSELANEVHDKICSSLHKTPITKDVIEIVRETTEGILSDMARWYTDLDLQMLIGVNSWQEGVDLLKFGGKGVYVARDFEYLAFGDSSLIRFLADKLYSKTMDIKAGMDLAIYLVKKAEDYIDGCGGPIDVAALEPIDRSYNRLSQGFIQQRLAKMEAQEKALTDLLIRKPFASST
jgi:20S proteasome alpha/beta subunit